MLFAQCEELLLGGYETGSLMGNVGDSALVSLMAEISDPALQKTVLRLSLAAARADGHLADREAIVVEAARHHWQLLDVEESSLPAARRRAVLPNPRVRVQGRAAATTCSTSG